MSKPLFIWAGGKNKMLKHYLPLMPTEVKSYCEPFFGGGAMFVHIIKTYNPSRLVINDINDDVMNIYRSIAYDYEVFKKRLNELENTYIPLNKEDRKKYYFEVRNEHAYDYEQWSKPVEAATLYFLMKTGFNGIYQLNKNTNGRYGTPSGLLNQKDTLYDREVLDWWNLVLQKTEILSGDYNQAVQDVKNTFHFFDPPYRDSFADYGNGFDDTKLLHLIAISNLRRNVFLCNRDSDDGWFDDNKMELNIARFPVTYTAGRRKKTDVGFVAKPATEVLLYRTVQNNPFE